MTQFRPISLCNVLYKICSKVLANRLREVLNDIIFEEQSAFIPGRLITNNVLLAYECIHYLKRKKGKTGCCAIKLDMAKAYDRVEWAYLRSIMVKLGFAEFWISTIMKCVETVSFSIRVNGHLSDFFHTLQRYQTRRSFISLPLSSMCKGFVMFIKIFRASFFVKRCKDWNTCAMDFSPIFC